MFPTPGTRLGVYEVVAPLGKAGMGEVWLARDTKLGREVALKTLPAEFAADPDRLVRFEREAKLLASLNHPNIGTIYGFEESGDTRFLVRGAEGVSCPPSSGEASAIMARPVVDEAIKPRL